MDEVKNTSNSECYYDNYLPNIPFTAQVPFLHFPLQLVFVKMLSGGSSETVVSFYRLYGVISQKTLIFNKRYNEDLNHVKVTVHPTYFF
jgi:hypothetical protein